MVWLYGSKLKRIPPEIGEMGALEYFDPYTSYDLHWFPYEITRCKNLRDSRVSTRALYGNYKNRMGFPRLTHNPVRYSGDIVKCSVCGKEMTYDQTNQLWISLRVGTDVIRYAHQGGADLQQPPDEDEVFEQEMKEKENNPKNIKQELADNQSQVKSKGNQLIKLIRKIWER
jgi:hypothetical protein